MHVVVGLFASPNLTPHAGILTPNRYMPLPIVNSTTDTQVFNGFRHLGRVERGKGTPCNLYDSVRPQSTHDIFSPTHQRMIQDSGPPEMSLEYVYHNKNRAMSIWAVDGNYNCEFENYE